MRKNCSSDREKLLKFEAEGREFAKFLRSLEQFFLTVGQNNFGNKIPLTLFGQNLEIPDIKTNKSIFLGELPPKEEEDDEEDSLTSPDKNANPEIALEELRAKHMRELQVKNFVTTFRFVSILGILALSFVVQ